MATPYDAVEIRKPNLVNACKTLGVLRAHRGIENHLHWMLDVCFGEDDCQVRKDNASQNLSLLKKIVLNLIRMDTTEKVKASMCQKRKRAAWDDDIRMAMLGIKPL